LIEDAARARTWLWKGAILGISIGGIFLVATLDHLTGVHVRIFPIYYLPIAVGAYYLSWKMGLFLAVLSAIGWLVSNWLADPNTFPLSTWIVNLSSMLMSFVTISLLIGKLREGFDRERDLSRQDPLTALPNSRAFHEYAELLFAGARRSGHPFTIAYVDLDNFKTVNDERGHREGDLVLKDTARTLQRFLRSSDVVARIGGDEFVAFLSDTDAQDARTLLERVSTTFTEEMTSKGWPVTASIGAVSFSLAPATLEEAIHAADGVMYEAKESGKNRVHLKTGGANGKSEQIQSPRAAADRSSRG
jgi:diguanylate cyclase (GGDEF)-like protein